MITSIIFCVISITLALANNDAPVVPVKPFTPEPIHITLNDLPPPYNTSSAAKPAIVVPVPPNATFMVPDTNFRVTICLDNLISPPQMIYTLTGEILITEMCGNRISVFADTSKTMAFIFRVGFKFLMQVHFVHIHIILEIKNYKVLVKYF